MFHKGSKIYFQAPDVAVSAGSATGPPHNIRQDENEEPDRLVFARLIKKMQSYHPSRDFELVEKAYNLARTAHMGQKRKSGEPYIIHPLEVACILAELELDRETITAGILHDIIEDTDYDYQYIKENFSEEIANLVDGVTKLEKLHHKNSTENKELEQAENYRKMFLAMSNDIRVIIIKIADRLHNLRTLKFMPEEKQRRIAQESLDIYAPLAGRLGIAVWRREMEDLSFRYSNNENYYQLKNKIQTKLNERMQYVDEIVHTLKVAMQQHNIGGNVDGRAKHFFSIYKKMKNSGKSLEQIHDLFAVRIIVDTEVQCYEALGVAHSLYKPIPERFKDYISAPKSNMYQSLHNSLIGPNGITFEIQIRTVDMHQTAENGIAAHWKYKEGKKHNAGAYSNESEKNAEEKLSWLKQILEWQKETPDNQEFLDALKGDLDVYAEYVHVFTPQGKVLILAKGSTCIDFAYAIHSAVGNKMAGARVNQKMEPKDYILKNGDQVEILTSQNVKGPTSEWLKIAKTSQAKNKIKQWLKKEDKEESIAKGKDILEKSAKRTGVAFSQLMTTEREKSLLARFSMKDIDVLYAAVGRGDIKEKTIINRLYDDHLQSIQKEPEQLLEEINKKAKHGNKTEQKGDVIIMGEENLSTRFSRCCGPVPGDEIVGFVTRGRGVTVHRTDCINIINLDPMEKSRLVEAHWNNDKKSQVFYVELNILCDNMGLITPVNQVFSKNDFQVQSFVARQAQDAGYIFSVAINVSDRDELDFISGKLKGVKGVFEVDRIQ